MRVPYRPSVSAPCAPDPVITTTTTSSSDESAKITGVQADLLIPGRGEPIKDGAVIVRGDRIAWVGPFSELPAEHRHETFTRVPVVMPGMWDLHTHFGGLGRDVRFFDDPKALLPGANVLAGAITVEDLRRTLEAGFTSVRELSGVSCSISIELTQNEDFS